MRHYEVMVILDPSLDERTVAPSLDTFLNVIRTTGGNVEKVEVWGKRRLSFEINKSAEGIYAVLDLTSTPEAVKELDRQLGLQETVLRTKVLRREPAKAAKLAAKAAAKADAKSAKSAARAAARA
ncbi:30S ribosomal protein S6 [Lentzea guizhouensis]|nr:30S ribosomal protein S6 [Lentzea guizhouensis]